MRRSLLSAFSVILLLVGLAVVLRGPIAVRIMRSVLERNMAANPIGALEDGLHVILCGAGGPLPDPSRSGPCIAIIAGRSMFVVDAGTNGARNLGPMGLRANDIQAVFLTHLHSDHIDGLGELAMLRWIGSAHTSPLPVLGPTGVDGVVAGFNQVYRLDQGYRTAHHGAAVANPAAAGMVARAFEVPAGGDPVTVWDTDGVRVLAFAVEHQPVDPAVGYRFEYGGRSVVISGDTKRSRAVLENARGADVLLHEALDAKLVGMMNDAATAAGNRNVAKILFDIPDYHTTPVEAAEIAQEAGVPHLVYYHVVPPLPLPGLDVVFLEGVDDAYSGEVTLGVDGTSISLPSGSTAIEVGSR